MKDHTAKGLKLNWSKKAAASRAKRSASSAPRGFELESYEQLLVKAIKKVKNPKILVLGATPELRDLALKHQAICVAVDISQDMLFKMSDVMRYKSNPNNLTVKMDWLKISEFFAPKTFDIILADASLNNVPPEKQAQLIFGLAKVLKSNGYFITRNFVYLPSKNKDSLSEIQKKYNLRQLDWLWLTIHLGQYSPWHTAIYNPKTRQLKFGKLLDLFFGLIEAKKFKLTKTDMKKLNNLKIHAYNVTHISFPEKDWLKIIKKYFIIENRVSKNDKEWTQYAPIWFLRKK